MVVGSVCGHKDRHFRLTSTRISAFHRSHLNINVAHARNVRKAKD